MAIISFKSVGKTTTQVQNEILSSSPVPIGIRTPVRSGVVETDGIFAMHYDIPEQVNDNLRNLIETNFGERLGLYDFGANLQELTLEITAREDFEAEVMLRIKTAVDKWMPYVSLKGFEMSNEVEEIRKTGVVKFSVSYDLPLLSVSDQGVDIILYVS